MNILFYEVRHCSPNFHEFTGSKKIFAEKLEKFFLSKSVSGYYKTKKKKWHGPLSHWCREDKTLVVRPLKKHSFLCVSSLRGLVEVQGFKPNRGLTFLPPSRGVAL